MLTARQRELFDFIEARLAKSGGVAPTFEEMRAALSLKYKSAIHGVLRRLEERGFIRRLRQRARAIEIIKRPAEPDPEDTGMGSDRVVYFKWNDTNKHLEPLR